MASSSSSSSSSSAFFYNLQSEILALSSAKSWPKAVKEWQRAGIEKLEVGEESQTCLCGHYPIRELCFITNSVNGN